MSRKRIIVLAAGMLALTGCGVPTTSTSSAKSPTKTVAQGQTARDGKFEFTVNRVRCGLHTFNDHQPQGQYCAVSLTASNIGQEPQTLDGTSQYLIDAAGRKYGSDAVANDDKLFLQQINPGVSVSGTAAYDVPAGFTPAKMELHDSMFSDGVTVAVVTTTASPKTTN